MDKVSKNQNSEDIKIPFKKKIKIEANKSNKKKNKIETREEQLKIIKEKYKDINAELNEHNEKEKYNKDYDYEDELINNNDKINEELNENKENKNEIINDEENILLQNNQHNICYFYNKNDKYKINLSANYI